MPRNVVDSVVLDEWSAVCAPRSTDQPRRAQEHLASNDEVLLDPRRGRDQAGTSVANFAADFTQSVPLSVNPAGIVSLTWVSLAYAEPLSYQPIGGAFFTWKLTVRELPLQPMHWPLCMVPP